MKKRIVHHDGVIYHITGDYETAISHFNDLRAHVFRLHQSNVNHLPIISAQKKYDDGTSARFQMVYGSKIVEIVAPEPKPGPRPKKIIREFIDRIVPIMRSSDSKYFVACLSGTFDGPYLLFENRFDIPASAFEDNVEHEIHMKLIGQSGTSDENGAFDQELFLVAQTGLKPEDDDLGLSEPVLTPDQSEHTWEEVDSVVKCGVEELSYTYECPENNYVTVHFNEFYMRSRVKGTMSGGTVSDLEHITINGTRLNIRGSGSVVHKAGWTTYCYADKMFSSDWPVQPIAFYNTDIFINENFDTYQTIPYSLSADQDGCDYRDGYAAFSSLGDGYFLGYVKSHMKEVLLGKALDATYISIDEWRQVRPERWEYTMGGEYSSMDTVDLWAQSDSIRVEMDKKSNFCAAFRLFEGKTSYAREQGEPVSCTIGVPDPVITSQYTAMFTDIFQVDNAEYSFNGPTSAQYPHFWNDPNSMRYYNTDSVARVTGIMCAVELNINTPRSYNYCYVGPNNNNSLTKTKFVSLNNNQWKHIVPDINRDDIIFTGFIHLALLRERLPNTMEVEA